MEKNGSKKIKIKFIGRKKKLKNDIFFEESIMIEYVIYYMLLVPSKI